MMEALDFLFCPMERKSSGINFFCPMKKDIKVLPWYLFMQVIIRFQFKWSDINFFQNLDTCQKRLLLHKSGLKQTKAITLVWSEWSEITRKSSAFYKRQSQWVNWKIGAKISKPGTLLCFFFLLHPSFVTFLLHTFLSHLLPPSPQFKSFFLHLVVVFFFLNFQFSPCLILSGFHLWLMHWEIFVSREV